MGARSGQSDRAESLWWARASWVLLAFAAACSGEAAPAAKGAADALSEGTDAALQAELPGGPDADAPDAVAEGTDASWADTPPADTPLPDTEINDATLADTAPADATASDSTAQDTAPETAPDSAGQTKDAAAFPDAGLAEPCVLPTTAGHHELNCFGHAVDLHIPATCTTAPCGLVTDVHGLTMSADMQDANTNLRALGDKYGYIVLQPSANPAPPVASWTPGTDDQKVWALLQAALSQLKVDPKRVHFMGFSQGGWMTWRMLCAHAEVFASVAPGAGCSFAGTEGCNFSASQKPAVEVPVLYMHGTKDILQSFSCGVQQRDAVVAAWKLKQSAVVSQDSKHIWTRYLSPKGTVFEFIQHDWAASSFLLVGHCYPGSTDQSSQLPGQIAGFGCKPPNAFAWGEAAMQFFIAHPKP